jgi:hypothetical protein
MIWHIFKKDWKLLWLFVVAIASLHWIAALVAFKLGLFGEDATLEMLSHWVPEIAMYGSAFLIAAIVHLEAIPGTRQDWLIRPIPRGSLLVEKFLFAVIMVEGPMFVATLFRGLANGFSWRLCLLTTTSYVLFLLFFLVLPVFAFASVTKNMTEAFIFWCGSTFIVGAFLVLAGSMNGAANGTLLGALHTGVGWIAEVFRFALIAIAAVTVVALQYFRRKTAVARFWLVVFGVLLMLSAFVPWRPAFAIEERLSPKPGAGANTTVALDQSLGRFKSPSGLLASAENDRPRYGHNATDIFLPLQIAGVRNDAILLVDQADVYLIDQKQREFYHGIGEEFEVAREGPKPQEAAVYQQIAFPMSIYRGAKDQAVQVRVDYSLTLFGLGRSYSIAALDGDVRMPGWGWCKTKMDDAGANVELRCMEPGKGPICGTAFLENGSSGVRNPSRSFCLSEYRPFQDKPWPNNFAHLGVNLPFRDASGLAKFPVDGPQLPKSRVVIRVYEPEDHFTRSLVTPLITLKDWEAQ